MARTLRERTDALEQEWRGLLTDITAGDRAQLPRFFELQEGWLRLTYAPTLHFLRGLPPDDPNALRMQHEIDEVVAKVLAKWRETLGA